MNDLTESKGGWLAVIEKFIEKGTPIEQLGKLLELQQQWERDQARKEFNVAFAAFKAEAPASIDRTGHVAYDTKGGGGKVDYHHVELHQAAEEMVPKLSKHGLSHSWEVEQGADGLITVTCHLEHSAGHSRAVKLRGASDTSGGKNPIQAVGSAVYYLERYTFLAVLGIAQGEDDDGQSSVQGDTVSGEQAAQILGLLDRLEATPKYREDFFKWLQVEKVQELPKSEFQKALVHLQRQLAKHKKNGNGNAQVHPEYGPDVPQEATA